MEDIKFTDAEKMSRRADRREDKNHVLLLAIMLPLLLSICLGIWLIRAGMPVEVIRSDTGAWDLRGVDFAQTTVRFSGSVEYIPGELLTPSEFEERKDEATVLDTYKMSTRYGTSRIKLRVPDDKNYIISESAPLSSDRIFINGVWMEDLGSPGKNAETNEEDTAFFYYTVQPTDGVIEIVQQVSNFAFRQMERQSGFVIGTPEMMREFVSRNYVTTGLMMGCYASLALVHIVLWLLFRKYRANLICALFSFSWVFWGATTGPNILMSMFSSIPWGVVLRIEYLCLPTAGPLFLLVTSVLFPGVIQKGFLIASACVSAVFIAIILFCDTLTTSYALRGFQVVMLIALSYTVIRMFWVIRHPDLPQVLLLAGGAVFIYACVRDILFYNSIYIFPGGSYTNDPLSEVALLFLVFLQMVAMLLNTVRELRDFRIKEAKLAEEIAMLDQAHKLRAEVMNTISHETRTPLAVLSGYAELIAMDLRIKGMDEQYADDLDMISAEAHHIAELMKGMQDIARSRDEAAEKSKLNFMETVRQIVRIYKHVFERNNTSLIIDAPDDLPPVYGNAAELSQVLFNLLSNAEKHTKDGEVRIRIRVAEDVQSDTDMQADADMLTVTLTDTGTGIPPEFLPYAFQLRAHGDPDGMGFGLALCRQIIGLHHGEIGIESEPGQGTTVRFTLPLYREEGDNA